VKKIKTVIDWESYYDKEINVKELGNQNYAKIADGYMLGIANEEVQDVGTPEYIFNRYGDYLQRPDIEPWAANSNFDRAFTEEYFGFLSNPWRCVLDVGRGQQLPGNLAGLAKQTLGREIDKSMRDGMQGRVYDMLDDKQKQDMLDYCLADCTEALDIINKLPPLSPLEEKLALQTRNLNYRGLRINTELVEKDRQRLFHVRHEAFQAIPWTVSASPLSPKALQCFCDQWRIAVPKSLAKSDDAFNLWVADMIQNYPQVAKVLTAMRVWRHSNMLIKKADTLLARVTDAGRLPLDLIYCGAPHTRRWSSRGFNVQNLDRFPVLQQALAAIFPHECDENGVHPGVWTRRWLVPDEGCVFGILDYSQIEPRCLASLSGNTQFLQLIREGFNPYEAYARLNLKWVGGELKTENEGLYKIAKAAVLALGYGCGAAKYRGAARAMAGLEISEEEAKVQVKDFRNANPEILKFWAQNDSLISNAGKNDGCQDIHVQMPSGEPLKHFNVASDTKGFNSYKAKGDTYARVFGLWGGVLCENRTQRFARDILGHTLGACEDAGIDTAFHAHDEGIFQLDKSSAKEDLEDIRKIMETNPPWCPEVPLGTDGGIYEHYVK